LGCVPAHGARAPTRTASDRSHRVSTPWMNRHVLPTVAAVDRDEGVPVPPKDGSHRAQPLLDRRTMLRFVGGAAIALPLGACAAGGGDDKRLRIAYQQFGSGTVMETYLTSVIQQFSQSRPHVVVELVPIVAAEHDYFTKNELMMSSERTAPDIVYEDTFILQADVEA